MTAKFGGIWVLVLVCLFSSQTPSDCAATMSNASADDVGHEVFPYSLLWRTELFRKCDVLPVVSALPHPYIPLALISHERVGWLDSLFLPQRDLLYSQMSLQR